ncbi:MAG: ribonuclease [Sulfurovum sp.]|nr:MAG: ribonuclease [Sulfurovum sp.]
MLKKHAGIMYWKSMLSKVLLDTNIIVDIFDDKRKSSEATIGVIKKMLEEGTTLYVNSDTLTTTFYLLRSQRKMTFTEAINAIKETSVFCELISIEKNDVLKTISLCETEDTLFKDYEDTLQYVCAKKVDAELILTNDKGFVSLDIEVSGTQGFNISTL